MYTIRNRRDQKVFEHMTNMFKAIFEEE